MVFAQTPEQECPYPPDGRAHAYKTGNIKWIDDGSDELIPFCTQWGWVCSEQYDSQGNYSHNKWFWAEMGGHYGEALCGGAILEPPSSSNDKRKTTSPRLVCGSIINTENLSVSEEIPLSFTPHSLFYSSDRAFGYLPNKSTNILISDAKNAYYDLEHADILINVAGQSIQALNIPVEQEVYTFTWDGLDGDGNLLSGADAEIEISYRSSKLVYADNPIGTASYEYFLGSPDLSESKIGNWRFSTHHYYDPRHHMLWRGDGIAITANAFSSTVELVAGTEGPLGNQPDGPITNFVFNELTAMEVDGLDRIFIAEKTDGSDLVRLIENDQVTTVAGSAINGQQLSVGDEIDSQAVDLGNIVTLEKSNNGLFIASNTGIYLLANEVVKYISEAESIVDMVTDGTDLYVSRFNSIDLVDVETGEVEKIAGGESVGFHGEGPLTTNIAPQPGLAVHDGVIYFSNGAAPFHISSVNLSEGRIDTVASSGQAHDGREYDSHEAKRSDGQYIRGHLSDLDVDTDGRLLTIEGRQLVLRDQGLRYELAGTGLLASQMRQARIGNQHALGDFSKISIGPQGDIFMITSPFSDQQERNAIVKKASSLSTNGEWNTQYVLSNDQTEVYEFDYSGRHLKTMFSSTGSTKFRFLYNPDGLLDGIVDAWGNTTSIQRNVDGIPISITAPFGQVFSVQIENEMLTSLTQPGEKTYVMTYSNSGLLESFESPGNGPSTFSYDAQGRLLSDTNSELGFKSFYEEDAEGRSLVLTTAEGTQSRYVTRYNSNLLGFERATINEDASEVLEQFALNQFNELVKKNTTTTKGEVLTETYVPSIRWGMLGPVTSVSYQTSGPYAWTENHAQTEALEQIENGLFDYRLVKTLTLGSSENLRNEVIDTIENKQTIESPEGRVTEILFDANELPLTVQRSGFEPVTYTWDEYGRLVEETQGTRFTEYSYGENGLLAHVNQSGLLSTTYSYDEAGRLSRIAVGSQPGVFYGHDDAGRISTVRPETHESQYFEYDSIGQLLRYIPAPADRRSNQRMRGGSYAIGSQIRSTHAVHHKSIPQRPDIVDSYRQSPSNPLATPPPNIPERPTPGLKTPLASRTYEYDLNGRLVKELFPNGATISHFYNSLGQLSESSSATRTMSYGYHLDSGLPKQSSSSEGVTIALEWVGSELRAETLSGLVNGQVSFVYQEGRIEAITVDGASGGGGQTNFRYDKDNLLVGTDDLILDRSLSSGLIEKITLGSTEEVRAYNNFGELVSQSIFINNNLFYTNSYERDAIGRIVKNNDSNYFFDSAGQLSGVLSPGYSEENIYDNNGNRIRTIANGDVVNAIYDRQDRLIKRGEDHYSYDSNGRLSLRSTNSKALLLNYDEFGFLTEAKLDNGDVIEYVTDANGRVVLKRRNGDVLHKFLYQDNLNPVAQLDSDDEVVNRFVYVSNQHVPDYLIKDFVIYRIVSDSRGSVQFVINVQNGAIAQELQYDAWGQVVFDSNPGFQPFGYAGGIYDVHTELVHFGKRDYDPSVGRWTAPDPALLDGDGPNLYSYVLSDPVNYIDPEGMRREARREGGGSSADRSASRSRVLQIIMDQIRKRPKKNYGSEPIPHPFRSRTRCAGGGVRG